MTFIKYTPEQADALDWLQENNGILLVEAGAGSGKSWFAEQVVRTLQPKKGLYTAFNKAIVEEGVARFKGTKIQCKTFHALAYSYVKPKKSIHDLSYTCITEKLSYHKKYQIITAIDKFYVSDSVDMYEFFEDYFDEVPDAKKLTELSIKYVELMVEGKIDPTFNFLLKYFHLLLVEGSVSCKYDLVILDEINDVTAVTLEIFKLIDAPKKLGLGETHQAIYHFMNLVNGFEKLKDATVFKFTKSFRCSEKIAKDIQSFMRRDVTEDFTFIGTDEPVVNGKTLYCTLTNAKIIQQINERIQLNQGFYLLRKLSDIFACPMAIISASRNKEIYQKKYKFLKEEAENYSNNKEKGQSFLQYLLANVDDQEVQSAVNLLLSLNRKGIQLFDLYNKAKDAPVDVNYTIATVFTSKGLEFERVDIADDLNTKITTIRNNGGIQNHEDLVAYRCYYVACSRCGVNLINATAL